MRYLNILPSEDFCSEQLPWYMRPYSERTKATREERRDSSVQLIRVLMAGMLPYSKLPNLHTWTNQPGEV